MLSVSFCRYGLVADLAECLLQRVFSYSTMDVRVAYDYVKACLADPTVSKVVLIAHSQGGIIASLVLDRLFADLPSESISKLVGWRRSHTSRILSKQWGSPILGSLHIRLCSISFQQPPPYPQTSNQSRNHTFPSIQPITRQRPLCGPPTLRPLDPPHRTLCQRAWPDPALGRPI